MISYGDDYYWVEQNNRFDQKKHIQRCTTCSSGKTCYMSLQERSVQNDKFSFTVYLCYLVYAPLYIAGPIISFNAFASQLDTPQKNYSSKQVACSVWKHLTPMDNFVVGYGVLNFMWLKFFLLWRYFRFWSLINGIEAPENMPKCLNNCYSLETFWKNWHASYNKWLVRYMYIPLGGAQRKLLNVWVVFTFVAIWHDLEWKLLSWSWLTCIFFIPEILIKSAANTFKVQGALGEFLFRELNAVAGAVTITCLMVANLVGFVIGPSGINWLISGFLRKEGLPIVGGMFIIFYIGTKLMFYISHSQKWRLKSRLLKVEDQQETLAGSESSADQGGDYSTDPSYWR
ncbi:hypothetical protein ACH5RR_022735 [Cinchona calisaya]|uniref:Membrane-bound O-acyltransferase C24H6.01c n=1 Tax=Cinchona calisaya TaxID=153742 RepID=A0ABD2Z8N2_9GENT